MTTGDVFEKYWCSSKQIMCQFATINGFCKLTACINHYRKDKIMKFIIKTCDDLGFELSRYEVNAEPHFSTMNGMVYFEFPSHYFAITKELFDEMVAERGEE